MKVIGMAFVATFTHADELYVYLPPFDEIWVDLDQTHFTFFRGGEMRSSSCGEVDLGIGPLQRLLREASRSTGELNCIIDGDVRFVGTDGDSEEYQGARNQTPPRRPTLKAQRIIFSI